MGTKGTITNTAIRTLYSDFTKPPFSPNPKAANGWGPKTTAVYLPIDKAGNVGTTATLSFAPIQYEDLGFNLPNFSFIGYTQNQFALIDKFYDVLATKIETDSTFRNSRAANALNAIGTNEALLYSLNAPMAFGGNVRGATAPELIDPKWAQQIDGEVETIINTHDLKVGKLGNSLSYDQTQFLMRVFHEFMHSYFTHGLTVYDQSVSLLDNMNRKIDAQTVRQYDLAYGGTEETFLALAAELGASANDIKKITESEMPNQINLYKGALKKEIVVEAYRQLTDPSKLNDPSDPKTLATLKKLDSEGIIKLKKGSGKDNTSRATKSNYEWEPDSKKTIAELTKTDIKNVGEIQWGATQNIFDTWAEAVEQAILVAKKFFSQNAGQVGQILGSQLGRYIARNENQATQILSSTVLGVVSQNIGEAIEQRLSASLDQPPLHEGFENIGEDFANAGIGVISSLLTAELFDSLGIDGTAGELGQSVFSAYLTTIIQNLDTIMAAENSAAKLGELLQGVQIGNIIGGFVGTKLAASLVEFDTIGGQIGSSVGSAIGAAVGIAAAADGAILGMKLGAWAGPIGAAIGAFIGFIVGGIIGTFFSTPPKSGADVIWNEQTREFMGVRPWGKGGAPKSGALGIATNAAELLNGVLTATGSRFADGGQVRLGGYGTDKKNFVYRTRDSAGREVTAFRSTDINLVMSYGAAVAVADLIPRLVGGDVYAKRAIIGTYSMAGIDPANIAVSAVSLFPNLEAHRIANAFNPTVMFGNIASARDYSDYLRNRSQIDVVIASDPTSAFAAGWTITFARALELGLVRRAISDWAGGWNMYMDEKPDGVIDGFGYTGAQLGFTLGGQGSRERLVLAFNFEDQVENVFGDTIDNAAKDSIVGTAGDDSIVVSVDRISNTSGLTINGTLATGSEHVIRVAAVIDGREGNDTIFGGDRGNDLLGGDGNDTLVGGKLDDWLFGDAGNDRLFAGAANPQFADGDAASVDAALNTQSNGDMLNGGDGDDVLYGSRGSDFLIGGMGNDLIYGGAGGDIVSGGAGDDSGPNGEARLFGGAGTDQYVFGFGSGRDVVFDESDNAAAPGSNGDSLNARIEQINAGTLARNWAGGGNYEVDGSVKGGEDAVAFGPGISFENLTLQRSGTAANPGWDLIIRLRARNPENGELVYTGDELIIKDWFEATRRVEWFRFTNGDEVRVSDIASYFVGTAGSDLILGTNLSDFLVGGDGNDRILGLYGHDYGFGGLGNDLVSGDNDNDWVSGGNGDDKVLGGLGNDTVFGDDGNDSIYGGAGADIVVGGHGDDDIAGGAGNDVFRYERGDGRDLLMDDYVDNWELVWAAGAYTNGYVQNSDGTVSKDGAVAFDGTRWLGVYNYDAGSQTLRRHLGALGGIRAANSGVDVLEFGVGIDIQDLMFRRIGADLQIAVSKGDGDGRSFDQIDDAITLTDWYAIGSSIENFVFAATGRHDISSWNISGAGTDGADTINGTAGVDWLTGNGGDDVIVGDLGADILSGNSGADTLRGGADVDVLFGGDGDDILEGGAGADILIGGLGVDIASYSGLAPSGSPSGIRAFLSAPHTNSKEAIGDSYDGVEGIEGTTGADKLGGDSDANVLRGLAGNDTLYGGAGDDTYEFNVSNGVDTILDAPFTTDEIVTAAGTFNTSQVTTEWTFLGRLSTASGSRECFRLVVRSLVTGEELYRSRDTIDFIYTYSARTSPNSPPRAMPQPSTWAASASNNGQWLSTVVTTGNGVQRVRELFNSNNGGQDTIAFGSGIGLSDLTFTRLNNDADLRIAYISTSHSVTVSGQNDVNRAVESLTFQDGLTADLTHLVVVGEAASTYDDLVVGDGSANILDGLEGDDVVSGAGGNDTLRGGEGDDILEGGAGSDALDGGGDSITAGVALSGTDISKPYGDTIRYVRSNAGVTIDLASRTANFGHAAGDTIAVGVGGFASIENVIGSEGFNDTLRGDARANRLAGLGGNDTLEGRGGDDLLSGGVGDDTLRGGDGDDNLAGEDGTDTLEGGIGGDLLAGGGGVDTLRGDAGDDVLSGGDGNDFLYGGSENDLIGGDEGDDQLFGDSGDDRLAGGAGTDTLQGGDGNDALAGELGNDLLVGGAGNDDYVFDAESGSDTVVDADGVNRIFIIGASAEQVWLYRSGSDLLVSMIGGGTTVTLQNYFGASGATRVREIALEYSGSLFLETAAPLIAAMAEASTTVPSTMPSELVSLLAAYWHPEGKSAPLVVNQAIDNSLGVIMSGNVGAVDHDQNIVSYSLEMEPDAGIVALNSATGNWTYTPIDNPSGTVFFQIRVTDADGNNALQTVDMTLPADPADPPVVTLVQVVEPQAPLTKPTFASGSWGVHIQSNLTDENSEILELRVLGVPAGISFNVGSDIGGGIWSFGSGPWPTEVRGPVGWSEDLALSVTATSRELSTNHTYTHAPVPLNIEINARPTGITASSQLQFNENTASGTVLTNLSMLDADAGESATFELMNDAGGRFTLDSDGTLRAGSVGLNYESATSHVIVVRVTDSGGLTYSREFNVGVANVNESPTLANATPSYSTNEDQALVGSTVATDPDNNISSYAVQTNGSRGSVIVNSGTGAWTYTPTANLYGTDTFQIRVSDGTLSVVQTVTVTVVSQNDAPTDITLTGATTIDERDRPITGTVLNAVVIGTLATTDIDAPDAGDFASHAYTVSDSRFEIVGGNTLRLKAGAALDFEAGSTVSFNITATDRNGTGFSYVKPFSFTVNDKDDYFYGTSGNDTITGTAGVNFIFGQGGVDTLTGANAVDTIDGGDGDDTIYGLGGNDTLTGGLGIDTIEGGTGVDTIYGGDGFDILRGQDGNDTIFGDAGNDTIQGGLGDDVLLDGGADNDIIDGNDGDDRLVGNTGNDTLNGGLGGDRFNFGAGTDTLTYAAATAGVTFSLAAGTGTGGEAAGDIFEDTPETIIGSGFADTITGSSSADTIDGGAGNDMIYGGAGNDRLIGGAGNDTLDAQSGDDYLEGGLGDDILIGGTENDTYVIDANSGNDEIRNFDPNGLDIDVVGYQGITDRQLWFERSGNDLIVTAVGTTSRTTVKDWYLITSATDRSNYKIDFFVSGAWQSDTINAEGLVTLMTGYTRPTTQTQFDTLHANSTFESQWSSAWGNNVAPTVPTIATQTINEDGTLTLGLTITDDITPANGLTVTVEAVRVDNNAIADLSVVNAPTISPADAGGNRTLTVTTKPNAAGQVAIKVRATDAGALTTERVFLLTVNAQADTPTLTVVQAVAPTGGLTQRTLDSGSWALDIQAALVDNDGSETLEVLIANVPSGITFNQGTNLTGGVWSFTPAQLTGLRIQGPNTWATDLALSVTAISRESSGPTATSVATPLNIVINARPTDIQTVSSMTFAENTASGLSLATFVRTDADGAGDTATYTLVDNAGGRFTIDSNGTLRAGSVAMNYEAATSHSITVRATDSGGLTYDKPFTVFVSNVNEAPTDIALSATSVNENVAVGTSIGTLSRSDVDASDTATYSFVSNPGNSFAIVGNDLRTNAALDFETANSYPITIRVTDGGSATYDKSFTMTVVNRNDAPTNITLSGTSAFENDPTGTLVGTLGRVDQDAGDTVSYSFVSNPGNAFQIVGNQLLTNSVFNFEAASSYPITIRATDGGAGTFDRGFTIGIVNRNEAPTDLWPDRVLEINENTAASQTVAVFAGSDPDAGATIDFYRQPSGALPTFDSLEHFDFLADKRTLVTSNAMLNYEAAPLLPGGGGQRGYQVLVRAIDNGGNSYDEVVSIVVKNVNETPTGLGLDRTLGIYENAGAGGGYAWLTGSDPENNATYSLVDTAGGRFALRSDGLFMTGSTPLDYDSASYNPVTGTRGYSVTLRAYDGQFTVDQPVWISVYDVNEAPTVNGGTFSIPETAPGANQYVLGSVTFSDPDIEASNRNMVYRAVGGDSGVFTVNSAGAISFTGEPANGGRLSAEYRSTYSLLVEGWDGGSIGAGLSSQAWMTINVQNNNVAPTITDAQLIFVDTPWPEQYPDFAHYDLILTGTDPDDLNSNLIYTIESIYDSNVEPRQQTLYDGNLYWYFNFSYTGWFLVTTDYPRYSYGNWSQVPTHKMRVRVTDPQGESTTRDIQVVPYSAYLLPVVLDLDGDGFELVDPRQSNLGYTMNSTSGRIGWVAKDDAFLTLDRNGNGSVDGVDEISFVGDLPGATSDLEGLVAFDSNGNGKLDVGDERFNEFSVWQDLNQDQQSQADELRGLSEAGIESISLTRSPRDQAQAVPMSNIISATAEFTKTDGSIGLVGDVALSFLPSTIQLKLDDVTHDENQEDPENQAEEIILDPSLDSIDTIDVRNLGTNEVEASWGSELELAGVPAQSTYSGSSLDPLAGLAEVDRSSHNEVLESWELKAHLENAQRALEGEQASVEQNAADVAPDHTAGPSLERPAAQQNEPKEDSEDPTPDFIAGQDEGSVETEIEFARPNVTALHQGLDLVSKRRLQMIEAMASFGTDDGATDLSLQSSRHVDAKTLELLTSVGLQRQVS